MDLRATTAAYISKFLSLVPGLKSLVLDSETARILGVVSSQSSLFRRDVFLTERLGAESSPAASTSLNHLSAIVFIRPTAENIRLLRRALSSPSYGAYHIFFSNITRPSYIEELADADSSALIAQVHEFYADFYALDTHLFSLATSPCIDAVLSSGSTHANPAFERTVDGIIATLLALKRRPDVRFQESSSLCKNLAERVAVRIDQESSLFAFRPADPPPLLLILDRCEDPVTPLLNQWTYESMVHELIGLENNRVSLEKAPGVPEDLRNVVLDASLDDFFRRNRYQNFGELGINLKKLVDAFQSHSQSNAGSGAGLASIEDMMRFVGSYPEFRKTASNVSKHVAISSELSRLVETQDLLAVSQLEQDVACREAEGEHRKQVMEMLGRRRVSPSDKLRLVMLYSLRYEQSQNIRQALSEMIDGLRASGVGADGIHLISSLKHYAGGAKRSGDVFSNRSFFAMASNTVRRGIGGVENVYTQHEPLLVYTVEVLLRRRLKASEFPTASGSDGGEGDSLFGGSGNNLLVDVSSGGQGNAVFIKPPREVIVFIAGGVTYEEAKCVSGINGGPNSFKPPEGSTTASAAAAAKQVGCRVIVGGSTVTNSSLFAVEIAQNANAVAIANSHGNEHVF